MVEFQVLEVGGLGPKLGDSLHLPKHTAKPLPALHVYDQFCRLCLTPKIGWGHLESSGNYEITLDSMGELYGVSLSHIQKGEKIPIVTVPSSVLKEFIIFQQKKREVIHIHNYKKGTDKGQGSSK